MRNFHAILVWVLIATLLAPAASTAADESPHLELDVVTFNIRYLNRNEEGKNHWRHRKQLVIDAIKSFDADLLGLQESLHQQLQDLQPAVDKYTVFGVGRDDGKRRGEYSPILFRTDRFKLDPDDSGTFWLSDTPGEIASRTWGNKIPRICTWVRLTDTLSKRSFYVFNTHWDHQSQESRLGAAKLIIERIKGRKHPEEPVILMGDFNATRANPAIQHLSKHLGDSYWLANPDASDTGTFHGFRGCKSGQKIDHIFVPEGTQVSSAAVLYFKREDAFPSDHYPVQAVLQFR
ncbi:MAG: endonuclease/exonuclease/phosphatase family metal-dependent hydrolase [Pseudoalteromonas tetraodonis]|jgi:endonuclease/exonuclease/phosphatase family metal-dependent hydrolase